MSERGQANYEALHGSLEALAPAERAGVRDVTWLAGPSLGAARNERGQVEIFLRGPILDCQHPNVRSVLEHDTWRQTDGTRVEASRLVLPAEHHYTALAAFILTHLQENGANEDLSSGFRRSEAAISVILDTWAKRDELVVGLCGELLVLRELLRQTKGRTSSVIDAWHGHRPSARDLQLDAVGVEIKTTRRDISRHHISGVRQVEIGHRADGGHETHLFLISVGVARLDDTGPQEHAWSLPSLIDSILLMLGETDSSPVGGSSPPKMLLEKVHAYGGGGWYDHADSAMRAKFSDLFTTTFTRAYDLRDEAIRVIRGTDLAEFRDVLPETMQYEVDLPLSVRGDINPVTGHVQAVRHVIASAGWANFRST